MLKLKCFEKDDFEMQVFGEGHFHKNILSLQFKILAPQETLIAKTAPRNPERLEELWKATCFECFIGPKNDPQYWEINLSPSGSWNVYHFSEYRQGMRRANASLKAFEWSEQAAANARTQYLTSAQIEIELPKKLDLSFAAILITKNSGKTHWALSHDGPRPDFHLRSSFSGTLELK